MAYTYEFPHPAVTVDIVVLTVADHELKVLLIRRGSPPFEGKWALPGGFVEPDESLKRAAWRELKEETGVNAGFLEQLGAFGHPDRDPRERVITVAYYALIPNERLKIAASSDAAEASLFPMSDLPALAFDHAKILRRARERLKDRFDESAVATQLLPESFTLSELQRACEIMLGRSIDKRNFRKKIRALDLVVPTGEQRRDGPHRPAKLYRAKGRRSRL